MLVGFCKGGGIVRWVWVREFEIFTVGNPPPYHGGHYWIFVKLTTNGGVSGIGEAYAVPFHPSAAEKMIADVCERCVVGRNPFHLEKLWRVVYSRGYAQRSDMSVTAALSAVETACWDIIGKELGKPVYELLGGRVREKLRAYTYLYPEDGDAADVYTCADAAAERAGEYAARGFTAVKFDPVGAYSAFDPRQLSLESLERAERFVNKIREAVGGRCDLLVGTHGQMTAAAAIRLARRLEPADPLWLEEPVPPENVEAMAQVARATAIPIATGERLATKYQFRDVLAKGAAAILQPALGCCGGILEGKKIAAMAEAHYAQIAPHLYCGPVEGAANIQLATCSPNFLILEGIKTWDGFYAEILREKIEWQDGYVIPPTAPGLGVTLDEEAARRHPYRGDEQHLGVHNEPL